MWKCHHCKTWPTWKKWRCWCWGCGGYQGRKDVEREGGAAASQKAIKICDHLFQLPHLIHLSGEWLCPYPPKATNLFSCLSLCIRMNLWNSQTCSPPPSNPTPLLLLLLLQLFHPSPPQPILWFVSFLPPLLQLFHCLSLLTFSPTPLCGHFLSSIPLSILPRQKRMHESNSNHILRETEREQQQDFVNGNLIRSEQGVRNTVHIPGSCLIVFGFVQIWLQLICTERVEQKLTLMETADSFCCVVRFLLFDFYMHSKGTSLWAVGYLFKFWWICFAERMMALGIRGGASLPQCLTLYFVKIRMRSLRRAAHHSQS